MNNRYCKCATGRTIWGSNAAGQGFYVVQETCRLAVGLPPLPVKWVPDLLSPGRAAGA